MPQPYFPRRTPRDDLREDVRHVVCYALGLMVIGLVLGLGQGGDVVRVAAVSLGVGSFVAAFLVSGVLLLFRRRQREFEEVWGSGHGRGDEP